MKTSAPGASRYGWLTWPALAYLLVFFLFPMINILSKSLFDPGFTLTNYITIVSVPVYSQVLLNTVRISLIVCAICFILGMPVAFLLVNVPERWQNALLMVVILPFWTSILVRSYAWLVLLQKSGVINRLLTNLSLIDKPLDLTYNLFGVLCGMSYVLLPYMILILYGSMRRLDMRLYTVAQTLGASRTRAMFKVIMPLSMSGIFGGLCVVFIMGAGYFITPALLGGRSETMIAMLIETQMNTLLDWGFGSALSLVLVLVVATCLALAWKLLKVDELISLESSE